MIGFVDFFLKFFFIYGGLWLMVSGGIGGGIVMNFSGVFLGSIV